MFHDSWELCPHTAEMWTPLTVLLLTYRLCAAGAGAHDIPLESAIGAGPERLRAVEQRLSQLSAHLAQLDGRLEARLAQRADGEWRPEDCAAVQQRHRLSGTYTVYPPTCGNGGGIRVYCDMETDGGGWTVISRRDDVPHHQDFNLNWQSYKWGFGNLSAEFWMGNEYLNLMTSLDQVQLRVDLKDWENGTAYATYTPFSVGTEEQKYVLKLGND
ncbi:Ficolin-1-A [Amphibalanus amphitrite]|uniref:Ficolin-1-A n=1 Tax=Amphibalanus amphitrite TaxID=1232801 RepID=A0A6A4VY98_AMPAM|nr:Ficolin-1-A [Amphibalanus amphitrite]